MPKSDEEIERMRQEFNPYADNDGFRDGYRLAESEKDSKYEKLVEGLKLQLNILYFNIPTGTVDAFEMIKLVKNHYESLESLITEIEGGDNDKAEG